MRAEAWRARYKGGQCRQVSTYICKQGSEEGGGVGKKEVAREGWKQEGRKGEQGARRQALDIDRTLHGHTHKISDDLFFPIQLQILFSFSVLPLLILPLLLPLPPPLSLPLSGGLWSPPYLSLPHSPQSLRGNARTMHAAGHQLDGLLLLQQVSASVWTGRVSLPLLLLSTVPPSVTLPSLPYSFPPSFPPSFSPSEPMPAEVMPRTEALPSSFHWASPPLSSSPQIFRLQGGC